MSEEIEKFYHPKSKKLEEEITKLFGELHGPWRTYFSNGKIRAKGNHKNGQRDGEEVHYNIRGEIVGMHHFKEGKFHGEAFFRNKAGVCTTTYYYENRKVSFDPKHCDLMAQFLKNHGFTVEKNHEVTNSYPL